MKQFSFYAKKNDYAYVNQLINRSNTRKYWHFWGVTDLVYFVVIGSAKHMARFYYESEKFRVGRDYKWVIDRKSRGD